MADTAAWLLDTAKYTKHKIRPLTAPCNGVWTDSGTYLCSYTRARGCTQSPQLVPFKEASVHRPSQRSRALTPLNTPPATGSFNSPWPSMSGAGKRNRACERATPYTYLRHSGDSAPKAQAAQSLTSKSWVPISILSRCRTLGALAPAIYALKHSLTVDNKNR